MASDLSPTRTKSTWKPRVVDGDLRFLQGGDGVSVWLGNGAAALEKDNWRSPIFAPPCVGGAGARATDEAVPVVEADDGPSLRYRFVGGFDSAALEVSWDEGEGTPAPWWVALKTFTGLQVKYPTPGKRTPLVFALADEDAYCYCDLDPCQECVANCKRGFVLYAWYGTGEVERVPCGR